MGKSMEAENIGSALWMNMMDQTWLLFCAERWLIEKRFWYLKETVRKKICFILYILCWCTSCCYTRSKHWSDILIVSRRFSCEKIQQTEKSQSQSDALKAWSNNSKSRFNFAFSHIWDQLIVRYKRDTISILRNWRWSINCKKRWTKYSPQISDHTLTVELKKLRFFLVIASSDLSWMGHHYKVQICGLINVYYQIMREGRILKIPRSMWDAWRSEHSLILSGEAYIQLIGYNSDHIILSYKRYSKRGNSAFLNEILRKKEWEKMST